MLYKTAKPDRPLSVEMVQENIRFLVEKNEPEDSQSKLTIRDAEKMIQAYYELGRLVDKAAYRLGLRFSAEEYSKLPLLERRRLLWRSTDRGILLQPDLHAAVSFLTRALCAGESIGLFKVKPGRRGRSPNVIAYLQLSILKWIRWQHGLGRPVDRATAEAADAAAISPDTVKNWRRDIGKAYGKGFVRDELRFAKMVGCAEARGLTEDDLKSGSSDEDYLLWQSFQTLDRDLGQLVWHLRKHKKGS